MPWTALIVSILAVGVFLWLALRNDFVRSMAPLASCSAAGVALTVALLVAGFSSGLLLFRIPEYGVAGLKDLLIVCGSALLSILMLSLIFKNTSAVLALAGALAGRAALNGGDLSLLWKFPLGWLAAGALVGLLAYLLNSFIRSGRSGVHLFREMPLWGVLIMLAGIAVAVLSGINLAPLFAGVTLTEGAWMMPAALALVILLAGARHFGGLAMSYAEDSFDASPSSAFSMLLAMALTLALFSFPFFRGLPSIPLSPFMLLLSAAYACRLSRGRSRINPEQGYRYLASLLLGPAIAAMQAYLGLGGVAAALLLVLLLLFLGNLRTRRQNAERLKLRTEEMSETAHRINELQIRAMQRENVSLQNLLSLRRSQILDDAEKITEHQHFIAEVYEELGKIEAAPESERGLLLREIRGKLRLRMNHGEGLKKFYAKAETLHKDFNARLLEKYPQLTPQERRLATLLRLEFSTKYIASLLGISESSVEVERHRMRKKLGLSRKDRLIDFIKNI